MRGNQYVDIFITYLSITAAASFATDIQPPNPLNPYGSATARSVITEAMLYDTEHEVVAAINAAKEELGDYVGCPEQVFNYLVPDFTPITLSDVEYIWKVKQAPGLASYRINAPDSGRRWPMVALGGYYATLAGYNANLPAMAQIAECMQAQQCTEETTGSADPLGLGVFGLAVIAPTDPWYSQGAIGQTTTFIAEQLPELTRPYTSGQFAGFRFVVADIAIDRGFVYGGLAYDHAWAGLMMIETALQQPDAAVAQKAWDSALLAADWATQQPPVANHNMNAKLICLLAQLYARTGDMEYRDTLIDQLKRGLIPGILMDQDLDGLVDGMAHQPFSELCRLAQKPGRMWDGHNSTAPYQAINAWAITEAYAAFRDRGDTYRADQLRPYAEAMLNNLAAEINEQGVPLNRNVITQMMHALLTGGWKVAAYENQPHPDWDQAIAALWNSHHTWSFGPAASNVGMLLVYLTDTPYQPLGFRQRN